MIEEKTLPWSDFSTIEVVLDGTYLLGKSKSGHEVYLCDQNLQKISESFDSVDEFFVVEKVGFYEVKSGEFSGIMRLSQNNHTMIVPLGTYEGRILSSSFCVFVLWNYKQKSYTIIDRNGTEIKTYQYMKFPARDMINSDGQAVIVGQDDSEGDICYGAVLICGSTQTPLIEELLPMSFSSQEIETKMRSLTV